VKGVAAPDTFERTTFPGGFFVSGVYVTRAVDEDQHWIL
jgi:hypothetical protein